MKNIFSYWNLQKENMTWVYILVVNVLVLDFMRSKICWFWRMKREFNDLKAENWPELRLNIQSVSRSKHTPSGL
jgi:DNA modification methylase